MNTIQMIIAGFSALAGGNIGTLIAHKISWFTRVTEEVGKMADGMTLMGLKPPEPEPEAKTVPEPAQEEKPLVPDAAEMTAQMPSLAPAELLAELEASAVAVARAAGFKPSDLDSAFESIKTVVERIKARL